MMDLKTRTEVIRRLYEIFADIRWIKENGRNALDVLDEFFIDGLETDIALCAARTVESMNKEVAKKK